MRMIVKPTPPDDVGDRRPFPEQGDGKARAFNLPRAGMRHTNYLEKAALHRTSGKRSGIVAQRCSNFPVKSYQPLVHEPFDERLRMLEGRHFPFPALQNKG